MTTNFTTYFAQFGSLTAKSETARTAKSPIENFTAKATEMISLIQNDAQEAKANWFRFNANGTITVVLKSGVRNLPLVNGSNEMVMPNKETAIAYLKQTILAAQAGLFNEAFVACKPPVRVKGPSKKSQKLAALETAIAAA